MTREEYVRGKIEAGMDIHLNDGVAWQKTKKGYCKTAIPFEIVESGKQKPRFSDSFVGLNHRISSMEGATGSWKPFILRDEEISNWSLETLQSGNRRRRIRKGLKNNEVIKVESIADFRQDISRVLKSTAIRNGHGHPPERYNLDNSEWWQVLLDIEKYTEFWCAFQDGKLAAYICLHVIDERIVVDGVKSDTDMLPGCPIDAIVYNIITSVQQRGAKEMWYGGASNRPTLDKFKESYGFKIEEIPYRTSFLGGLVTMPEFFNRFIKRSVS